MTPPRRRDWHERAHQTRPCPEWGQPARVLHPRLEHVRMIGSTLFAEADYVASCGHLRRFLLVPDIAGEMGLLVPILGEAA